MQFKHQQSQRQRVSTIRQACLFTTKAQDKIDTALRRRFAKGYDQTRVRRWSGVVGWVETLSSLVRTLFLRSQQSLALLRNYIGQHEGCGTGLAHSSKSPRHSAPMKEPQGGQPFVVRAQSVSRGLSKTFRMRSPRRSTSASESITPQAWPRYKINSKCQRTTNASSAIWLWVCRT